MDRRIPTAPGPTWLWFLVTAAIVALYAAVRLVIFPAEVVPLAYGLPLLIFLWRRDLVLLWGMTICFVLILASKVNVIIGSTPEDVPRHAFYWAMQMLSLLVVAISVHIVIRLARQLQRGAERLRRTNAELEAINDELSAREEEINQQNEELQAQATELEQQAEELSSQAEEVQSLNEHLVARGRILDRLVSLTAAGTSERQMLARVGEAVMDLLEPRAAGAAIYQRSQGEMVVHPLAGLAPAAGEFGAGETLADLVIARNSPGYIPDLELRPDLVVPLLEDGTRPRSVLAAPMPSDDSGHGALEVYAREPGEWSEFEMRLARWCAEQFGSLWTTARLREDLARLVESERAARSEAEKVNRDKDEFVAMLAHELRTPISAILGWASLLRLVTDKPIEMNRGIEVIERNARQQAQLISDLLDMKQMVSGMIRLDIKPVDPLDVVEAAIDVVRPAAEANDVRIEKRFAAVHCRIAADPNRLQQVIWNLLTNAVKFTPPGGTIFVTFDASADQVMISVRDTGKGIEPEILPQIFQRYRQADSSVSRHHGGLGLGLAIVKHLVELHNGTVEMLSDGPDTGTECIVKLPAIGVRSPDREQPAIAAGAGAAVEMANTTLSGLRLLVVDDDTDSLEVITRVLSHRGAAVTAAESAAEAFEHLEANEFDVLISDIGMPEMDGYAFIRQLREQGPAWARKIPAIALTAFARPEDRKRALRAGFHQHLAKPVDASELGASAVSLAARG